MLQQAIEDEGQARRIPQDGQCMSWLSPVAAQPGGAAEGQTASFESYEQCGRQEVLVVKTGNFRGYIYII